MLKSKSFDVSFTPKGIECAMKTKSKMAAAREFGADAKQIMVWYGLKKSSLP